MSIVYVGLGANLGNPADQIQQALDHLNAMDQVSVVQVSTLHETLAVSNFEQPNYLNGVAKLTTELTPEALLDVTESIERTMGRTSKGMGDPREIDIDILFFDDQIVSTDRLTIPHPMAHERLFVLVPFCELEPTFIHPVLGLSMDALRTDLDGH